MSFNHRKAYILRRRIFYRLGIPALGFLALAFCDPATAQPFPRRVALVVANAEYDHGGHLVNPTNDSRLIVNALQRGHFETGSARFNLKGQDFRNALRSFQSQADGAEVALIYYAGHGIEARGQDWLIPTDALLDRDDDLDFEAIDVDLVVRATKGARYRIVVLDACRNNPFGRSWVGSTRSIEHGLLEQGAPEVLIIYSASKGQFAFDGPKGYSPFAQAFARRIAEPGVAIQLLSGHLTDDVLAATNQQQRPFMSSSLGGKDLVLIPDELRKDKYISDGQGPSIFDPRQMELAFWNAVQSSGDNAQYQAYLERYPRGEFVLLARLRMAYHEGGVNNAGGIGVDIDARANKSDISAQVQIAMGYLNGTAIKTDYYKAFQWFQKAAVQGNVEAELYMGFLYFVGQGVEQDYTEAMRWYIKSAASGNSGAENNIGTMYEEGRGVVNSREEAARWYQRSAEHGNALGARNLGLLLESGPSNGRK